MCRIAAYFGTPARLSAMLLENLGIDKVVRFGKLEDWKAALADLEKPQGSKAPP